MQQVRTAITPATGESPTGVYAQTTQALSNMGAVLRAAGTDLENVVTVSIFLSDMNNFESVSRIYGVLP